MLRKPKKSLAKTTFAKPSNGHFWLLKHLLLSQQVTISYKNMFDKKTNKKASKHQNQT
jgi:hypothetical protein